jgi:exodeoxyribonuclease VII small subunit
MAEKAKSKEASFEANLAKLEEIVDKLENQDIPLEEALKLFQEGVALNKSCAEKLTQVEKEVKKVVEKTDGSYSLDNFEEADKA